MNKKELLDNILGVLYQVKEDKAKLLRIYDFLVEEIYEAETEEIEIPEKFKELIKHIAQMMDAGHICYINPKTLEHVEIFDTDESFYFEEEHLFQKDLDEVENWEQKIVIERLESHESFKIMESFVDEIPEGKFQNKLIGALNRKKPFANFKYLVENSDYRQNWFDFKENYLEKHVYEIFQLEGIK